jgi:hypothetical protein
MNTEQGQKIAGALKAVAQLHSDTSKLLLDCDAYIANGRRSVFGNNATRDLTWHAKAAHWMAEGVYRFYEGNSLNVDAITVTFFKPDEEFEPLLKVGRIQYKVPGDGLADALRQVCNEWDLWWLYFDSGAARQVGKVIEYSDLDDHRIVWARLIAVPLFTIHRIEDVRQLMTRVVESGPNCRVAEA